MLISKFLRLLLHRNVENDSFLSCGSLVIHFEIGYVIRILGFRMGRISTKGQLVGIQESVVRGAKSKYRKAPSRDAAPITDRLIGPLGGVGLSLNLVGAYVLP